MGLDLLATESASGGAVGMELPTMAGATARTPMQMICDIPCMAKGINWICWFYAGLYWLLVEFPNWLADKLGWFGWLVTAFLAIIVIIIFILIGLVLTEVSAALQPASFLHRTPLIRAGLYISMGMLMLGHHVGPIPWGIAALLVGVIAFFDGIGIINFSVLGISFWIGIGWAIVMVLIAAVQFGMVVPFGLAFLALGPIFGLPWDWFENMYNIFIGVGLVVFIITCFYPSVVPGFETILTIFDYILRVTHMYEMPC